MPLELQELGPKDEALFQKVAFCEDAAYSTPFNGIWTIFNPTALYATPAESILACASRQWAHHLSDQPSSHWLQIVDTETGEVAAGANWVIYDEEKPYDKPERREVGAPWIPENEGRSVVEKALRGWYEIRFARMNKPHVLLNIAFTHPKHRRRGAGRLFMEWGVKKADELRVESFIEATDEGVLLYENYGYRVMEPFVMDAKPENGEELDEGWKRMYKACDLPFHGAFMWRPVGGKWTEDTKAPWEVSNGQI
jgi:GNAT superfamily N-acetyltransferase